MLHFFTKDLTFSRKTGGPNVIRTSIDITSSQPTANTRVMLALQGFDIRYSGGDHHIKRVLLRPELDEHGPFGNSVEIRVEMGLRDSSGSWDDPFEGTAKLGLIVVKDADVEVDTDQSIQFSTASGQGPQYTAVYPQAHNANIHHLALLRGFDISYEEKDHHLMEIDAGVEAITLQTGATIFDGVRGRLGLRDSSGFWDDRYGGAIDFSLLRFPSGLLSFYKDGVARVTGKNSGPVSTSAPYVSPAELQDGDVFVGMTGFQLAYTNGDHHVLRMVSQLSRSVRPEPGKTTIDVGYTGGLRDSSGSWDDPYSCEGQFVVLSRNQEVALSDNRAGVRQFTSKLGHVRKFLVAPLLRKR